MPTMRHLIDLITADQAGAAPRRLRVVDYLDDGRYQRLDEANRSAFLLKLYGAKLAAKFTASEADEPVDVVAAVQHAPGADLGQKMLAFLASFDPTQTKEYAQWLCVRYLKNQIKLEDGPRAREYLTLFNRVKRIRSAQVAHRIADPNIMSYGDLDALFAVLEPFMTDVAHTPTGGTEEERLTRRMAQNDQASILYDGPDMQVVTPHTEAAAKFWGRDTLWCTTWGPPRTNQFAYYNSFGPLYIVTLKPGGEKYQLSFDYVRGGNARGEFMDKNDRRIDVAAFIRAHPALIGLVGEAKLVPWAPAIGLDLFSPAMARMISAQQAGQELASHYHDAEAALARLPADIVADYAFQKALLSQRPAMLAALPQAVYAANLIALLRECVGLFAYVPPALKTPETAEAASLTMRRFRDIEALLPAGLWTPVVTTRYWDLRATEDYTLRLASVPAPYRTPEVIVKLLARHAEDIAEFTAILTGRIARDIVRTEWAAGFDLPGKYFDKTMAETLIKTNARGAFALFGRIPAEYWTDAVADAYVHLAEASFTKLPERFHDVARAKAFITTNPDKINQVPRTLIRPETVGKLDGAAFITLLKHAAPGIVGGDIILAFARRCPNDQVMEEVAAALPDRDLSPAVLGMLLHRGLLPIARIPDDQLTDDAIVQRLDGYYGAARAPELADLPADRVTPKLAAKLTQRHPQLVRMLPDSALSPDVLSNVVHMVIRDEEMRNRRYSKQATMDDDLKALAKASLARFPLADWTPAHLVAMIDRDLFLPNLDELPPQLLVANVINAVDRRDPTQVGHLPSTPAIQMQLVQAVKRRWEIILHVRKAQLTEPVMRTVLQGWADAAGHNGYVTSMGYPQHVADGPALKAALLALPRAHWSEACYEAAVIDLLPLAKIPPARRTDAVLKAALLRAPETIKAIADPVAWLDQHVLAKDTTAKWRKAMENIGFVMHRGKWASTRDDLPKVPLDGHPGFTVSVVPRGAVNRQVYLFKNGKPVLALRSDGGMVRLDKAGDYRAYRPELITLAQTYFADFALGDLEKLDIYKKNGIVGTGDDGTTTAMGRLQWGVIDRRNGHIYNGYLGHTKLIQVYTTFKHGYDQTGDHDGTKIVNQKLAFTHADDIVRYLTAHRVDYFWDLRDIGIAFDQHSGMRQVALRQVGTIGGLGVWTDGTQLNVYGPMGWLAGGRLRAGGRISRVTVRYDYNQLSTALEAALGQIAAQMVDQTSKPLAIPLDVRPDPTEQDT